MTLGKKIAKLRRAHDWTQSQFADKVGVHNRHISRWETDRNRPSLTTLERIAREFNVSVDELTEVDGRKTAEDILHDNVLLHQFELVQELPEEDRDVITRVIDAFLTKKRVEQALGRAG